MQIDLRDINQEQFNVDPHIISGEQCFLVTSLHGIKQLRFNNNKL